MKKGLFLILMLLGLLNTVEVTAQRLRTTAMFDGDTTTRPTAGMYGIGVRAAIPYLVRNTGNTRRIALFSELSGKANINNPTFTGKITTPDILVSNLTPSQLVATDASDNLVSLASSTYPSLSELAFVKGLTANAQTQLSGKFNTPTGLTTNFLPRWSGTGLVNSQIFDNGVNVGIGTNSPTRALQIQNSGSNLFSVQRTGYDAWGFLQSVGTGIHFYNYTDARTDMYIDGSGNIGMGTTNPAQALHVFTATPYQIQVQRSGVGSALIGVSAQTANSTGDLLFDGGQASQGFAFRSRDASNAVVNSLGIDRNGNVGIGTMGPTQKLEIHGGNDVGISIFNTNSNFWDITNGLNGTLNFIRGRSNNFMQINQFGNVGIGTTSPTERLHVIGNTLIPLNNSYLCYTPNFGIGTGTGLEIFTDTGDVIRFLTGGKGGTERMRIASNGNVGIGTTSLTERALGISKSITGASTAYGVFQSGQIQSDVTVESYGFRNLLNTAAATFNLGNYYHYAATSIAFGAGSTIGGQIGFLANASLTGAANNYGFVSQIPAGTGRWNLFMSGTANNHMAGSLGIGTTSLAGHGIRNSKTITGGASGFSHANYSDGQIQSDVTGAAWYFRSFANTQPTAFTLPEIRHFDATQGTIGAGSSVTVQTAFLAGSTLVGASFANYGFRGNIPAGTGRWNAFMDGTAQNYFRGNVGIGVGKTVPVFELEVEGTTQSTAFRLSANNTAPASSTATCTVGEIRIDGNFIYYCSAANTWRRAALAAY